MGRGKTYDFHRKQNLGPVPMGTEQAGDVLGAMLSGGVTHEFAPGHVYTIPASWEANRLGTATLLARSPTACLALDGPVIHSA